MATLDQQIPYPATIQQMDRQYVEFAGTAQAPSPYTVQAQETTVLTASGDILGYSRPSGVQAAAKGMRVSYSATGATQPWAAQEIRVHFKNHRPFLHIISVDRTITVRTSPRTLLSCPRARRLWMLW